MANSNSCCSIEMEPKTLNQVQLNHAREVAADVVQKMESNEAMTLFIEGLRPIEEVREMKQTVEEKTEKLVVDELNENAQIIGRPYCPCQCSCATIIESPDQSMLREPLSAPF